MGIDHDTAVRGAGHRLLVVEDGPQTLFPRQGVVDYADGGEAMQAVPFVEGRPAELGGPPRVAHPCGPLSVTSKWSTFKLAWSLTSTRIGEVARW